METTLKNTSAVVQQNICKIKEGFQSTSLDAKPKAKCRGSSIGLCQKLPTKQMQQKYDTLNVELPNKQKKNRCGMSECSHIKTSAKNKYISELALYVYDLEG